MSYVGNKGPADDIEEEGFTSRILGVSGKELGKVGQPGAMLRYHFDEVFLQAFQAWPGHEVRDGADCIEDPTLEDG